MKSTIFRGLTCAAILGLAISGCKKSESINSSVTEKIGLNTDGTTSAVSKDKSAIYFEIAANVTGNVLEGLFTGSGAFSSNGKYEETYKWNGKYYHSDVVFSNADGTIEFNVNGAINFDSESHGTGTLKWKIKKSTGIYEGLKGEGTGTDEISEWNASTGTGTSNQSWEGAIEKTSSQQPSAPGGKNGEEISTSDTFILISFSQKKTTPAYKVWDIAIKYDWKFAGASNISKIELLTSGNGSDWTVYKTTDYLTTDNSTMADTYTYGTFACKSTKGYVYSRLKVYYNNGNILTSDLNPVSFSGTFCCSCW